jgi:drug/metabolite transporter (DMT)-like permease
MFSVTMPQGDKSKAIMLTVVASLIWGTSFPGVKWGLPHAGNDILFLWLRFIVASALTLTVVLLAKRFSFAILKNPVIWLIGACNAGGFIAQYVGLNYTTASKTALLVDINVVAVAFLSYFVFRERISRKQTVGIFLGVMGIVCLTAEGGLSLDGSQLLGDVLVFLAGWGWAFFIVLNKKMLTKHNGIEISSAAIATSTVWLAIPVTWLYWTGADFTVQAEAWYAIVYLGVFCTSIAMLLWAMGLERVSATSSATIMLLEVLTALAISMSLLGETLRFLSILGAGFVLVAIYLVASADGRRTRQSVPSHM